MTQLNTQLPTAILQQITQSAGRLVFLYEFTNEASLLIIGDFTDVLGIKINNIEIHPELLLDSIFIDDIEDVKAMYSLLVSTPFAGNMEFRVVNEDQSLRTIYSNISSKFDEQGNVLWIGGFVEDITEKRKYEENLNEYTSRKNSVLEVLTHELGGRCQWLRI